MCGRKNLSDREKGGDISKPDLKSCLALPGPGGWVDRSGAWLYRAVSWGREFVFLDFACMLASSMKLDIS